MAPQQYKLCQPCRFTIAKSKVSFNYSWTMTKYPMLFILFLPAWLMAQTDSTLQTVLLETKEQEMIVSPSLSAMLVGERQWEVNLFNFLTTRDIKNIRITKTSFSGNPDTTISFFQSTRLEQRLQLQYGLPAGRRLNLGLDLYATHLRTDEDIHSSPLRVLGNQQSSGQSQRSISAIGPRIRWMPFVFLPELSVQGSAVFGLSKDLTTRQLYGRDRTQLLGQMTFYQRFRPWLYAFVQTDVSVFLKNDDFQNNTFSFPLFFYTSAQLVGLRARAYPKVYGLFSWSYAIVYDDNTRGEEWLVKRSFELQVGLGLLAQLEPRWGLTLWAQQPVAYGSESASSEVVARSWYGISLGVRYHWIPKSLRQSAGAIPP